MSILVNKYDDFENGLYSKGNVEEEIKRQIELALEPLAQGNEGYVRCEELSLNGTNLVAKILIRHKHKSGGVIIYAGKNWVELDTDVTNPKDEDLKLCIEFMGKHCVNLEDLYRIIVIIIGSFNI
ncbi:hypothetical protein LGL55_05985 [Clostridium tagluense]|uniref:hypothetical protein n=1 Tax=Clostridium tagluense TaxID=360422 RepID=UPI001CF19569|nr:hypothetical protein [Clostridium tagluense]MCB2310672.1 hypothetical protein [Clostridium tagluense]MCB2315598.1 hypothetical protein [Clostridium tagluense]MCB2320452.1 hypothetical protein [Clostridium tagluense]MCB2325265.1 hypothetical protein [Clostridium tagluense]MCB2330117.1 hypothetical protein [Clostridium tagluense]